MVLVFKNTSTLSQRRASSKNSHGKVVGIALATWMKWNDNFSPTTNHVKTLSISIERSNLTCFQQ